MSVGASEAIHRLWDDLSDFDASQSEQASSRLMRFLCDLVGAGNATWAGAIRMGDSGDDDPLRGWRVAVIQALHPVIATPPAEGHFRDIMRVWDRREMDPSFLLPMRDVGAFRTYSFRRDLPPEWFETPFYKHHYGSIGAHDGVYVAFPLNEDCESHFGFYSGETIDETKIARLAYALRGIKWFHRRLMLSHGLLSATTPLTPTERRVLQLLLTEASEKHVAHQLGLAVSTTHQHVASIFRKFGVRSRAGLMSLWLRQG
jgi:DNA-binding CsgD family transcriptional regulator